MSGPTSPAAGSVSGHYLQSVPAETPLEMPTQNLRRFGKRKPIASPGIGARRFILLAGTGLLIALGGSVMASLLVPGGVNALEAATFVLFMVLFAWVAFAFVSAVAGFVVGWTAPRRAADEPQPIIFHRTAILAPTYNEDPGRILSAVQAISEDLAAMGVAELYDVFVLSDTRNEAIAQAEATGVMRLRLKLGEASGVYYRRRPRNTDRKAGNIAEWVQRFGGDYAFMLILDADSLMTGDTIVRLTAAMEAEPKLGLLQTVPSIVNGETLFARLQQFAARAYGSMLAAGQDWWSGAEGNYWGHNAILRTRAFAESAGLPHLPGRRPFGGHIMSHDFVEAALLRRAGWAVRLDASLGGSFEEAPPTILDMTIRDRRWCQGNLQHAGVLGAAGLHWISRLHLMRGILAYVTSPLWLFLLCIGAGVWIQQSEPQLGSATAAWLFALTMALLLTPKLMSATLTARDAAERRGFGGKAGFAVSMVGEMIVSALVAPVLMLMQSAAVVDVLLGRDSGWGVQQRDSGRMTRREAWRTHRGHVVIGLAGAGLAFTLDPAMFWWTSPVYAGLVLSAPLSALLARGDLGMAARKLGLFTTPEERVVPPLVARAAELRAAYDAEQVTRRQIDRLFRASVPCYQPTHMSPVGGARSRVQAIRAVGGATAADC